MDAEAKVLQSIVPAPCRITETSEDSLTGKCSLSRPRVGVLAAVAIFATAMLWSRIVNEALYRGDDATWYYLLSAHAWREPYSWQPMLFIIMSWVAPASFKQYIFWSIIILLGILYALHRMSFHPVDQLIVVLFFSWSFYGLHFLLNFQRQCLAIVFLLCAMPGGKRGFLWRVFSLASHQYAVIIQVFWVLRRFSVRAALIGTTISIPIIYLIMAHVGLLKDNSAGYAEYGQSSFGHLAIKQAINVVFVAVLWAVGRADTKLRALSVTYIVICMPALFWPQYAGLLNRIDYYLLPILIILSLHPDSGPSGRRISRVCIVLYTCVTCAMWMKLNLGWIVFDFGGTW
ncbi:MAG TPA: hypothetical protein VGG45_08980 [Terracidiphilus sp.]|jgi:hypothetical protein